VGVDSLAAAEVAMIALNAATSAVCAMSFLLKRWHAPNPGE
jgi:hypothetical protein